MAQRREGRPSDELSVMVIDEDKCHANSTKYMLSELNYYVTVYTSPTEALDFLKKHSQDVDFVLASVQMEDLNGFQFLEAAKEMHKNIQVIMMSTETTMFTMKTCVELGARFLVKKPLDAETIHNMWQHLDAKVLKINKIKYLFRGIGDKTQDGQEIGNYVVQPKDDGTEMRAHLMWTPYVQRKFLSALQILGENASPKKIQMIMDIDTIGRKQISTHLQKHRKRMEREQNMKMFIDPCGKGASSYKSKKTRHTIPNTPKYHPYKQVDHPTERTMIQSLFEDIEDKNVYTAMRRALQLGTFFDESQYSGDPSSEESDETAGDVMREDGTANEANVSNSSSHDTVAAETYNANAAQESTNKSICKEPVGLVNYPDSEDYD